MRKLILSLCVIAASGAYVAKAAMSKEGGVEALLDRVTFRPAPAALPPLDLDGTGLPDGLLAPQAPGSQSGAALVPSSTPPSANLALADPTPSVSAAPVVPPQSVAPTVVAPTVVAPTVVAPSPDTTSAIAQDAPSGSSPPPASLLPGVRPPLPRLSPRDRRDGGRQSEQTFAFNAPRPAPVNPAAPAPAPVQTAPAPSAPSAPAAAATPAATPAPAPTGQYRDGTYTGTTSDAYYGLVQVRAHVQGGKLTAIDVLDYPSDRSRSRAINSYALPALEREVVRAQNVNVDVVGGATLTTVAYLRSLNSALGQAK